HPSSLIYPAEELCIGSKTLRKNLIQDKSCQSSPIVIDATESRLSASFPNKMSIKNRSNSNLFGDDEEESMGKFCEGMTSKTLMSARQYSLKLQQASTEFKQHETIEILAHNKEGLFLHQKDP
ncbi:hypothetical protein BHE74_00037242, partial [Ensete ventricosum]